MVNASTTRVGAGPAWVGIAVALLVGAALRPASGQETAALERRLDSLAARVRVATAVKLAYDDSAKRAIALLDSVDVGPARVLTPPALAATVRWAMQVGLAKIDSQYGPFPDMLVETHTDRLIVVRPKVPLAAIAVVLSDNSSTPSPVRVDYNHVGPAAPGDKPSLRDGYEVHIVSRGDDQYSTTFSDSVGLEGAVEERLLEVIADHRIRDTGWFANLARPWQKGTEEDWALRRVALASAPTAVSRRCFQGDEVSCMAALGVRPTADPILDMYDAADRRSAVLWLAEVGRISRSSTDRCLAGDDAECVDLLRKIPGAAEISRSPLGSDMRTALVQEALTLGGPGAFGRYVRDTGTPAEQLSTTAGVSLDSLVASWRGHIRTAKLPSGNMTPMIAAVSLVWMALFSGFALKSSRWR